VSADLGVLGRHGADSQTEIEYSREHIPDDREMAPYELTGFRRIVFLVLYALIVASSFAGLAYTFYANPWFGLMTLPVCYVFNNLLFTLSHSKLHASFIELPEAKMSVLCHHSFIHHYRNSCVYHEKWLETRMSYFMDTRAVFDPAFRGFTAAIPLISAVLFLIDPVLGIAFFSSHYVAELLQSTIHEWYHNPVRNRKTFYSFPVYWAFTFLEKIGLASTKNHNAHHRHQLPTLEKVEVWLDLYLPFGEIPAAHLWKKALAKYVPGQTNMTQYVSRTATLFAFVAFSVINPAIYVAIFLALFR
jgi:hypothetical protein